MGGSLIYCDHESDYRQLTDKSSVKELRRKGGVTITAEDFVGDDDGVQTHFEENDNLFLEQYVCPYCKQIDGRGETLGFALIDAYNSPVKFRLTDEGWVVDEIQTKEYTLEGLTTDLCIVQGFL